MVAAANALQLEQLRQILRAKTPRVERKGEVLATGIESLDRLLEGGVPKGGITVLAGSPGSGRMTLAARLIANETRHCRAVAWVDADATLYPPALAQAGVELERLLLVRGSNERSLFATEQIAAAGAFSIVVASNCDQWLNVPRLRRLQTAAEATRTAAVLLLDPKTPLPNAALRLKLSRKSSGIQVELEKQKSQYWSGTASRDARVMIQNAS
jgi:hypothetical protein